MIISTKGPQNVGQIQKQFEFGNIFLSPEEYQRESSWNISQKKLLIDTIFRGMDIPKFYLWKITERTLATGYPNGDTKEHYKKLLENKRKINDDYDPYIYEVIDGQQRIRTILEFMGVPPPNEHTYRGVWLTAFETLADTPMAKGKFYNNLNPEQQSKFDETPLSVMILEDATIDEIRDMFLRLQNGTPLNSQEKRDAMGSSLGRYARDLAKLPFFTTSVAFDSSGSSHHLVASQMLYLQSKNFIVSCTSQQLDKAYTLYKSATFDKDTAKQTKKVLTILHGIFPSKCIHLNQNYALTLYWLISKITELYTIQEADHETIRSNFILTDIARIEAMSRGYPNEADSTYEQLSLAMSRGNTGVDGITTRHNIVGATLFHSVSLLPIPKLDPTRNFSHEEKLIIYHRAGGKCQLNHNGKQCGRHIEFEDAVVDHIIPHSQEGKTVIENGRLAYSSCNIARSNKKEFDPATQCKLISHPVTPDAVQD